MCSWSAQGADLTVSAEASQAVEASAVIITIPLSLLQRDTIEFDPPLHAKAEALAGLAMGPVHRVMLRYPTAVWETLLGGPVRAGTFLHARGQPFPTFWTHDPGSPWLTAWCGGPRAARLDAEGDDGHHRRRDRVGPRAFFPVHRAPRPSRSRSSFTTGSAIPGRSVPIPMSRWAAARRGRHWPSHSTASCSSPVRRRTPRARHLPSPARSCREHAPHRKS